jgi:hypothetical protein
MSQSRSDGAANLQAGDSRWCSLYRMGAVAALLSLLIIPLSVLTFFI